MKVEGNEHKLIVGKGYYCSDVSDEHAEAYKASKDQGFIFKWRGEKFWHEKCPYVSWAYAVPAEEPKYITAELPEVQDTYPDWWTGKPVLGQVRDSKDEEWSDFYVFCVYVPSNFPCTIFTADRTDGIYPEVANFDNWNGQLTAWKYFKPYVKPEKEEIPFDELCKLGG